LLPVLKITATWRISNFPGSDASLRISALDFGSKSPPYAPRFERRDMTVGLRIESAKKAWPISGLPAITAEAGKIHRRLRLPTVDARFGRSANGFRATHQAHGGTTWDTFRLAGRAARSNGCSR